MATMSMGRAIGWLAEQDPDRPSITEVMVTGPGQTGETRTVTRAELDRRTNRLARAYEAMGVGHDDFVTIALPNSIEFYEAAIAAWKVGATPQPVSYRLPARELDAIVELADPPIVVGVDDAGPGRVAVPRGFEPDPSLSDQPLAEDRVAKSWKAPTSGGSTGRPKLIVAGQPAVTDPERPRTGSMPANGCQLVPGPLYHNGPFLFSMNGLLGGSHLVVMSRFDPSVTLQLVEEHRVDWMLLVPTMMHRIWRLPEEERAARDLSSLRAILHLAAPCPVWLKLAWIEWLGPERVLELYAGTEGNGTTWITGTEYLEHQGSVGKPLAGTEMKIFDPDGNELPPGEVGEIWMRPASGGTPSFRYIGATATERDGWQTLGDMGWMDADGYLYIADRRTDLIIAGGANIYPAEVESALDEHPRVRSSAVIGLPDPDLGQRVHAIVQADGDVTDDELRAHLAERLVAYKIPRSFERTDEYLRDDAGKVRRSALRESRVADGSFAN